MPARKSTFRLIVAVATAATILSACSSATTAGGFPRVEGTYNGTLTASAVDLGIAEQAPMRLLVEQDGERVTASGLLDDQGSTVAFVLTGSIDKTGHFTSDNQAAPGVLDTSLCGRIRPISGSLTFSGRKAVLAILVDTELCGLISYNAELTR